MTTSTSPTKAWTRLLGSSSSEDARALATGSDGAIYMAGYMSGSLDGQTNSGDYDAFLTKWIVTDTTPPTIAITGNKSSLKAGETATLTFTLSEPSTHFVASDVFYSGGTFSGFSGSGTTYTATFVLAANSSDNGNVSVGNRMFSDSTGNLNQDGADSDNAVEVTRASGDNVYVIDVGYETVTQNVVGRLTFAGHNVTVGGPPTSLDGFQQVCDLRYAQALSSSETNPYTTFITNGRFAYFTTEHSGFPARNNSVAGLVSSLGGGSTTIGQIGNADNVSAWVETRYITSGIAVNFNAVSEIVNDRGIQLFQDSLGRTQGMSWIGCAGSFSPEVEGTIITAADVNWPDDNGFRVGGSSAQQQNVQALDDIIAGIVRGTVEGTIDESGNSGSASPKIAVSSNKTALKAGETATLTFTLSEASTDFTADDVLVAGGTLSGFSGSGATYTATFTPTANSTAKVLLTV